MLSRRRMRMASHLHALHGSDLAGASFPLALLLVIVISVGEVVYTHIKKECFGFRAGTRDGCVHEQNVLQATVVARMMISGGVLIPLWVWRSLAGERIMAARQHTVPGALDKALLGELPTVSAPAIAPLAEPADVSCAPPGSQDPPGSRIWGGGKPGWTVLASRDVWEETNQAVVSAVFLAFGLFLGNLAIFVFGALIAMFQPTWTQGPAWNYACHTCTASVHEAEMCSADPGSIRLNLCLLTWNARGVLVLTETALAIFLASVAANIPLRLWDPIAQEASRVSGKPWLLRLIRSHRVIAVPVLLVGPSLVMFELIEYLVAPKWVIELYGILLAVLVVVLAAMVSWVMPPVSVLRAIIIQKCHSATGHGAPFGLLHWQTFLPSLYTAFFYTADSGVHYTLRVVLISSLYAFAPPSTYSGLHFFILCWVARVGLALLLLLSRDRPTTFDDLENSASGACYGLVSDAGMLREALQRHIEGLPPLSDPPLTYKATLSRMDDTIAVSYRWQPTECSICPGLAINMSRWQLQQLLVALQRSSCLYVWLDHISVPQDGSELQNTLLARMMAVYACVNETLVLRSLEETGGRYHQRTWTLPEFVCSVKIDVRSEAASAAEEGWVSGHKAAVTDMEEQYAGDLRRRYSLRRNKCRPYWLHGTSVELMSDSDLLDALKLFEDLDWQLGCTVPADRVRALYPVLFDVPVQNHDEMLALATAIAQKAEQLMPGAELCAKVWYYLETFALVARGGAVEPSSSRGLSKRGVRPLSTMTSLASIVSSKAPSLVSRLSKSTRGVLPAVEDSVQVVDTR